MSEEVADPECRQVAAMAHATLQRIEQEAEEVESHANKFKLSLQVWLGWEAVGRAMCETVSAVF